jgi:electron transport complex protein RnfG
VAKFFQESWLILVLGVSFTALLAGTQVSLIDQIRENQNRALNEAISEVVPELATTEEIEIDGTRVFKCLDAGGKVTGWAVQASGSGFVGKITLVVGFNAAADTISGIKVIEQVETPGLGNKIKEPWWDHQYAGKKADPDPDRKLTVVKQKPVEGSNEIQAITGATWSSRFVTGIVNNVIETVLPKLEAHR